MNQSSAKPLNVSEYPYINDKLLSELDNLFRFVPPTQLRKSIQKIFFTYLISNPGFPAEFPQMAEDIYFLIQFLEKAEEEIPM